MKGATVKTEYHVDYDLEKKVYFGPDLEQDSDDPTLDVELIPE